MSYINSFKCYIIVKSVLIVKSNYAKQMIKDRVKYIDI